MHTYSKITFILAISLFSLILPVSTFGASGPKIRDYEAALKAEMPDYLKLTDYEIEVTENLGNKVEPIWATRFNATAKTTEDLYQYVNEKYELQKHGIRPGLFEGDPLPSEVWMPDSLYKNSDFFHPKPKSRKVSFLQTTFKKNSSVKIYGKTIAKLYRGTFSVDYKFDGYPFSSQEIGKPYTDFKPEKIGLIVSGSDREKEFYSLLKQHDEEVKKKNDKKIKEHQERLANANNTLIGYWVMGNSLWIYFSKDGTGRFSYHMGGYIEFKWRANREYIEYEVTDWRDQQGRVIKNKLNNAKGITVKRILEDINHDWFKFDRRQKWDTYFRNDSKYRRVTDESKAKKRLYLDHRTSGQSTSNREQVSPKNDANHNITPINHKKNLTTTSPQNSTTSQISKRHPDGIPPIFISKFDKYLARPNKKAVALALNRKIMKWTAGSSYGYPTQPQANKIALDECNKNVINNKIKTNCKLYAEGDVIVW